MYTSWFYKSVDTPVRVRVKPNKAADYFTCQREGMIFPFKILKSRCYVTEAEAAEDVRRRRSALPVPPDVAAVPAALPPDTLAAALNRLADLAERAIALWEREIARRDF